MQYLFVFIAFFIFTSNAFAEKTYKRVALVIGNSKYIHATKLNNPPNDARKLAEKFRGHKFDKVVHAKELTRGGMIKSLREFRYLANKADIAVIYFSGHGMEMEGVNYLVPVDAKLETEYDVKDEAVTLDRILEAIKGAGRLQLIILDACRNNPFKNKLARSKGLTRSQVTRGFVPVEVSGNVMVAYAAKGGTVAYDGKGENSPFAQALLDHLFEPGLDIRIALGRVRDSVKSHMNGKQVPWDYGSVGGQVISLVPGVKKRDPQKDLEITRLKNEASLLTGEINTLNSQLKSLEKNEAVSKREVRKHKLAAEKNRQEAIRYRNTLEATKNKLEKNLVALQARIGWAEVLGANQLKIYEKYLRENPKSQQVEKATKRIFFLRQLKKRWMHLKSSKNLIAIEKFIIDAKGTEFETVALTVLETLKYEEEKDWDTAAVLGSRRAFESFLEQWPSGYFSVSAKKRIAEINTIEKKWIKLRKETSETELEDFIKKHGGSEFGPDATVLLADIRRRKQADKGKPKVNALSGRDLKKLINGARLQLRISDSFIFFDTEFLPSYRVRVGRNFLSKLLSRKLAAEGGFKAEYWDGNRRILVQGIAGIVTSSVDKSGTLYLMQMHGGEATASDVNDKDRKYATYQIIAGPQGYICNGTKWQSILSTKDPEPIVDHCSIDIQKK